LTAAQININKPPAKKRVLVAPLDWGLGHATRCVPVIRTLLQQDCEVVIAAEKDGAALLQKEFPALQILPLAGYRVSYSKKKFFFFLKMMLQFPKVRRAIKREHLWLDKIITEQKIDLIISDNRYGLWSNKVPGIFITHQLFIKTGNIFSEQIAQKINYNYINKFSVCWVPDAAGEHNLAGKLSHPDKLPAVPVKYIGVLSRLEKKDAAKSIDLLVLLSGPEPQRTALEDLLLPQMDHSIGKIILVRGLPRGGSKLSLQNENITMYDHLSAAELNDLMAAAKLVICRSGYSTIMDLAALQQKAILVATPGQGEQEYLSRYLSEQNYCIAAEQSGLVLKDLMNDISQKILTPFPASSEKELQQAVQLILQQIR
jgi:UDP-N-acetylglucosamine transferase subunit ALG13